MTWKDFHWSLCSEKFLYHRVWDNTSVKFSGPGAFMRHNFYSFTKVIRIFYFFCFTLNQIKLKLPSSPKASTWIIRDCPENSTLKSSFDPSFRSPASLLVLCGFHPYICKFSHRDSPPSQYISIFTFLGFFLHLQDHLRLQTRIKAQLWWYSTNLRYMIFSFPLFSKRTLLKVSRSASPKRYQRDRLQITREDFSVQMFEANF